MSNTVRKLQTVDKVEILILVDNYVDVLLPGSDAVVRPKLAKKGVIAQNVPIAEHGLSLLITIYRNGQSHSMLLDSGYNPDTVRHNMDVLGVDSSAIDAIVLSHGHMDHTGGLKSLLKDMKRSIPFIVHADAFSRRFMDLPTGFRLQFPQVLTREDLQQMNVDVIELEGPKSLFEDSILVTGPVPRVTPFEKGMPNAFIDRNGETVHDPITDDQAIVINLAGRGLVVISGCAHAGIVNSILYAQQLTGQSQVCTVMGGFHLTGQGTDDLIRDTVTEIKKFSPEMIVPMHCTGLKAIWRFEQEFPQSFVLSSVGTKIVLSRPN
jgi:7,8-dihydropterin-6-yl-methyl-4-(beta-D-ribofuranosyl)aminobenzene 5'-phosphate synthase